MLYDYFASSLKASRFVFVLRVEVCWPIIKFPSSLASMVGPLAVITSKISSSLVLVGISVVELPVSIISKGKIVNECRFGLSHHHMFTAFLSSYLYKGIIY